MNTDDRAAVGEFAMDAIDAIVDDVGATEVGINDMMLIVNLRIEDGGERKNVTQIFCTDGKSYVQRGLIDEALDGVKGL